MEEVSVGVYEVSARSELTGQTVSLNGELDDALTRLRAQLKPDGRIAPLKP